ncbi:hypothetical protein STEG23_033814 [Scotinomys teguina]
MADLEAVLADVSYLMAMEKSKATPAARASKKILLPEPSIRSVMQKYLEDRGEVTFEKIFSQKLGYLLFRDFCLNHLEEAKPLVEFYEEIKKYEKLETEEERVVRSREIFDSYIMKELLACSHPFSKNATEHVQGHLVKKQVPPDLFQPYIEEICQNLRGDVFQKFIESDKFTRFCQWKNVELNIHLTMNDFSVHRIIGRGGFGEVYGCRKADTGKMYAMKCLDKKRIKMKQGETLALNERIMLSLVSTGDCPFIVCMSYAFHTPDKLSFILDLMNGGDLHYHLSQHGVFSEVDMRFYAAEIILGLEHMHNRFVVYRDLKPANILLDEHGHVRISDLGLACDFSKKKPHASVGTHGYMAPEVLQKGVAYDSSADWFSLGCMLFKLLRGHSPFRQHKTKDKHEIDRMTLTMAVELPDSFSPELRSLLEGLLQRDVNRRLGCLGRGAQEVKESPFFRSLDWQMVFLQKYPPPLIPPRGEVNAADAFDIGSFDEEDTKGIKLLDSDQELYRNFPLTISERWQQEVAETVFDTINAETDRLEARKKAKNKQLGHEEDYALGKDCIMHGYMSKMGNPFLTQWQRRYFYLFPNRLEWRGEGEAPQSLLTMEEIQSVEETQIKERKCLLLKIRGGKQFVLQCDVSGGLEHDIEQEDPRGRTPLELAVSLGNLESVRVLLRHNANVGKESHQGWAVLQEAVSTGDPEMVQLVLQYRDFQRATQRLAGIPELLNKLRQAPDFYVEMRWEFTSWVPLVSKMCPSDVYRVWKRGESLRVDTSLLGFEHMTWQRGQRSFIFRGQEAGALVMEVDHDRQVVHTETLGPALHEPEALLAAMRPSEEHVASRLTSPIVSTHLDTRNVAFERNKCGIWGWRSEKMETVSGYEAKVYSATNVELVTRTRTEHLSDQDKLRNKGGKTPFQSFLGMAQQHSSHSGAPVQQAASPTNPTAISPEEYFDPSFSLESRNIGRPIEMSSKVQRFKATLWLSEEHPLSLGDQVTPIIDLMAISNAHFAKLRDFITLRLPPGFPVKIEIPLFHVLNARITFSNLCGCDEPVSSVWVPAPTSAVSASGSPFPCEVDPSVFEVPEGYSVLGAEHSEPLRDEDDDLLQFAIQQSLLEAGTEAEQVTVWEALTNTRPGILPPPQVTVFEEQLQLEQALQESLQLSTESRGPESPQRTPPSPAPPSFEEQLRLALELSSREQEERERRGQQEEEDLQRILQLSLTEH